VRFSGEPPPAHRPAPMLDENRAALWQEFSLPGMPDRVAPTPHPSELKEMK